MIPSILALFRLLSLALPSSQSKTGREVLAKDNGIPAEDRFAVEGTAKRIEAGLAGPLSRRTVA